MGMASMENPKNKNIAIRRNFNIIKRSSPIIRIRSSSFTVNILNIHLICPCGKGGGLCLYIHWLILYQKLLFIKTLLF
jgi:hypothetical protein